MKLKIFQITYNGGDKDWISAKTNIQALQVHSDFTGISLIEFATDDEIIEIPEKDWPKFIIKNEDGTDRESFSSFMARENKPDFIASTNY